MNTPEIEDRKSIDCSVVVPTYNSELFIERTVTEIERVMEAHGCTYEIILVNDGSVDRTWNCIRSLVDRHRGLKCINLARNFGQHNAIMCGLRYSSGKVVVTIDDDLQNPPHEIPRLLQKLDGDFDLVYGIERSRGHRRFRNLGSHIFLGIFKKIFGVSYKPTSYRAIKRAVVEELLKLKTNYVFLDGLLAWQTGFVGTVEVEHRKRESGASGYGIRKLILHSLNLITNFSSLPLKVASFFGVIFSALGMLAGAYYLLKFIVFGIAVPGFTSIILSILIFSGIQLMLLGVVGEYIGRINSVINSKPQFVVRDVEAGLDEDVDN